MTRFWVKKIIVILGIIALSACADYKKWHKDDDPPRVQFADSQFYIDGEFIELSGRGILRIRQNSDRLNKNISSLVGIKSPFSKPEKRDRLRELIKSLDTGDGFDGFVPKRLRGIGGFQGRLLLKYFLVCTDDELRSLGRLKVIGKIKKWIYDQKATVNNEKYKEEDEALGSGYIFWHAKADDCKGIEHDYKFHIAVDKAYQLKKNLEKEGYGLNFGDLDMEMPQKEIDRIKYEERRFDYKLHAKGTGIHILTVFLDNKLVHKSDPIYESDKESCIDVFFAGEPPAYELPDQEGYCMGRCDDPPVINTSGG